MTYLRSARTNRNRTIYCSDRTGTWQIWSWDRATRTHRQLTDHAHGVNHAAISPNGLRVTWFNTTRGNETGVWMTQSFDSAPGEGTVVSDLPPSHAQGVEVGDDVVLAGLATVDDGFTVYRVREGEATPIYHHAQQPMRVSGLSADESLVTIQHSEHGNPDQSRLRALRVDTGEFVGELADPGKQLVPIAFSPRDGDSRVLVQHERNGHWELLLWDPVSSRTREIPIGEPGEIANRWNICKYDQLARWSPDADRLVLALDQGANSALYEYDLTASNPQQALTRLTTPAGTIDELLLSPAGVEYRWGSVTDAWQYRSVDDPEPLFPVEAPPERTDVRLTELAVPGPGGPVPVLLVEPGGPRPTGGRPTVIGPHGGPQDRSGNAPLWPLYEDMVNRGCLVALPEYRGSIGNGSAWRYGSYGRVGIAESDDLHAVITHLTDHGLADPTRVAMAGSSYGGYLALMTAGRYPDQLTGGVVASAPICDLAAMYYDPLLVPEHRAFQRARLGGTREFAPKAWLDGSPVTYLPSMTADILITYHKDDPRCGPAQIEAFFAQARGLEQTHISRRRFPGGHNSLHQSAILSEDVRDLQLTYLSERLGLSADPTASAGGLPGAAAAEAIDSRPLSLATTIRATSKVGITVGAVVAAWTRTRIAVTALSEPLTSSRRMPQRSGAGDSDLGFIVNRTKDIEARLWRLTSITRRATGLKLVDELIKSAAVIPETLERLIENLQREPDDTETARTRSARIALELTMTAINGLDALRRDLATT